MRLYSELWNSDIFFWFPCPFDWVISPQKSQGQKTKEASLDGCVAQNHKCTWSSSFIPRKKGKEVNPGFYYEPSFLGLSSPAQELSTGL